METLKIYYDQEGQTLTIWFDDPSEEYLVDEVGSPEFVVIS